MHAGASAAMAARSDSSMPATRGRGDYLEFDCSVLGQEPAAQLLLWTLVRADAIAGDPPLLDRAVDLSRRHGVHVCRVLGNGVLEALELLVGTLGRRQAPRPDAGPLRAIADRALPRAVPAVCRSAGDCCRCGIRSIATATASTPSSPRCCRDSGTAACGRPFRRSRGWRMPAAAPASFASRPSTAGSSRRRRPTPSIARRSATRSWASAVVAVSTTPVNRHGGRARIVYRDLDVEQLGAVYERVLDYEPARPTPSARPTLLRTREVRKVERDVLHASRDDGLSGPPHAGAAGEGPQRRTRSWRSGFSIRPWAAARFSSPPADISARSSRTR